MGRPFCPQGCPCCQDDVYLEEDAWGEYVVCWRCGHILAEAEFDRLIQLRRLPVYLKPQRKAS